MIIPENVASVLLAVALGGVVVLGGAVAVLRSRVARLRRAYAAALGGDEPRYLFEVLEDQVHDIRGLREALVGLADEIDELRDIQTTAVSRVGIVRYDAFPDMGGALSFSVALLDDHATGVLLSAINGRQETRCYAKPVIEGTSSHELSDEEHDALAAARETPRHRLAVDTERQRPRVP